VIEALFALLAHPVLPWVLSGAIVAAAFGLWLRFVHRLAPLEQALRRAVALVEEAQGKTGFRQRLAALSRELARDPLLGPSWSAFAATLRPAPGGEEAIGYLHRPRDHFDERLIQAAGINVRFYQTLPQLLVGVGLFFTFVGLVAALYFASRGVASPEVAVAQAALKDLLAAATFKFATSIAGLGSSLLFSWREKAALHRVQHLMERFALALEARMTPISLEQVAAAQLDELRHHGVALQRLVEASGEGLPRAAEEALERELARAVAPFAAAMERLARRVDERGEDLLRVSVQGQAPSRRRQGGMAPVESTPSRDAAWGLLLRELRALRETLVRRTAPAGGDSGGGAESEEKVSAAAGGGLVARDAAAAEARLGRLLALMGRLHARLTGRGVRRRELIEALERLQEEVRLAAASLRELRERLARERPQEEEAVLTLGRLEEELRRSRETLAELAQSVGERK